jgi:hypothetical protein
MLANEEESRVVFERHQHLSARFSADLTAFCLYTDNGLISLEKNNENRPLSDTFA